MRRGTCVLGRIGWELLCERSREAFVERHHRHVGDVGERLDEALAKAKELILTALE